MSQLAGTNVIPAVLTDARVYKDGGGLLGIGNVELPDFEALTESLTGLGIAGEVDAVVVGHFKAMTLKIKWNTTTKQALSLLEPVAHQLDIRGSVQSYDAGAGEYAHEGLKVVVKGQPKKAGLGKLEPAKKMEPESELEVVYIKVWQDGEELVELDKFNYVFRVMGKDATAKIRSNLGM